MEFTLKTIISASPEEVYNAWLSTSGHAGITGSPASASHIKGEKFMAWDGYIHGVNISLKPYEEIIQSWRTSEFSEDESDSTIKILLREKSGQTELTLKHSELPEHGEQYINGWKEHYFKPMKAYFSKTAIRDGMSEHSESP